MKKRILKSLVFLISISISMTLPGQQKIIVDQNGQGDFTTIQSAFASINATTLSSDVEVHIRAGEYDEQLTLQQIDNSASDYSITIRSESGNANDVVLKNSTIQSTIDRILTIKEVDHVRVEYLSFETSSGNQDVPHK